MKDHSEDELDRIRNEYTRRQQNTALSYRYSIYKHANLFMQQQRTRSELVLLRRYGFEALATRRVLEVGCGNGGVLLEYLRYGTNPRCLYGIDLMPQRLMEAHQRIPPLSFACANAQQIPFPDDHFDLILQFTMFTSILDDTIKQSVAREMIRVLKPGGMILWYDFWLNPTNKQTRGIRPPEIKRLFPGCQFDFHRITLAPPIARRVVPVSWIFALLLEKARIFNSHYLVAIRPAPQAA